VNIYITVTDSQHGLESQDPSQLENSARASSPRLGAHPAVHEHQPKNAPFTTSYVPERLYIHIFVNRANDSGGCTASLIASLARLKDPLESMVNRRSALLFVIEQDLDRFTDIYVQIVDKTAAEVFVQMAKIAGVLQPGIGIELLASAVVHFSPARVVSAANFPDVLQEICRRHDDIQTSKSLPVPLAQRLSDSRSQSADHPSGPSKSKSGRKAPDNRPRECLNQHLSVEKQLSLLQHNRQLSINRLQKKLAKAVEESDIKNIKKYKKNLAREERQLQNRCTKLLNAKELVGPAGPSQ
jgi:hypothetical protein